MVQIDRPVPPVLQLLFPHVVLLRKFRCILHFRVHIFLVSFDGRVGEARISCVETVDEGRRKSDLCCMVSLLGVV
jgi:hypothetical protein